MYSLLLTVIYIALTGLGLPEILWSMASAGISSLSLFYLSIIISGSAIISALLSGFLTKLKSGIEADLISLIIFVLSLILLIYIHTYTFCCISAFAYGISAGRMGFSANKNMSLKLKRHNIIWINAVYCTGISMGPMILSISSYIRFTGIDSILLTLMKSILTMSFFVCLCFWKFKEPDTVFSKAESIAIFPRDIFIKHTLRISICAFCSAAAEISVGSYLAIYASGIFSVTDKEASISYTVFFGSFILFRIIYGFIARHISDRTVIHLSAVISEIGVLLLSLPYGKVYFFTGTVILSAGLSCIYPTFIHMLSKVKNEKLLTAETSALTVSTYSGSLTAFILFYVGAFQGSIFPIFLFSLLFVIFLLSSLSDRCSDKFKYLFPEKYRQQ
jgi:fucose permease